LFFAILVGILLSSNKELREEQLKTEAARAAEAKRRTELRDALDDMSSTMVGDLLAKQVQLTSEHRDFLRKNLAYYQAFAQETGEDEKSWTAVADANIRVADICRTLGVTNDSESAYKRAIQLITWLSTEFPDDQFENQRKLALAHNNLANLLRRQERNDDV